MVKVCKHLGLSIAVGLLLVSCQEKMEIAKSGTLVPKTVDEDSNLPSMMINGVHLHIESFGAAGKPIIIMIHGGPGGDYRYLLNARELANEGFQVVFYDQRGSGLSQRMNKSDYPLKNNGSTDLMYKDLKSIIETFRKAHQAVILFGHSWGAMLASGFTGRYPKLINGLILCEPGGLKWEDVKTYVKNSRSLNIWSEALNDATYLDQFITGAENDHAILDYKMTMFASNNPITGEGDFDQISHWRSGAVISSVLFEESERVYTDFSKGIQQFNKPVLFLYSDRNRAYPDTWATKIITVFNKVELNKISGAGHDGIMTNPTVWANQTKPKTLSYLRNIIQ